MGVEFIIFYIICMYLLGPGTAVYGLVIICRRQVRLTSHKVLRGYSASVAGGLCMIVGIAFTSLLWAMRVYLPH
jgi:hypothetical protein